MYRLGLLLTFLFFTFSLWAQADREEKIRIEWVKDLKRFVYEWEKENSEIVSTQPQRDLLKDFSFFQEAFAADHFDCFFGGWPSILVKQKGKQICENPKRGNPHYQKGKCQINNQIHCQPLLFGEGLCVDFKMAREKQLVFSSCEEKFRKKSDYSFLKNLNQEAKTELKDISVLAYKICKEGSTGIQKSKPMCKHLMSKFDSALSSIERAPASSFTMPEPLSNAKQKVPEVCPPASVDQKITDQSNEFIQTINGDVDTLYSEIKEEFKSSAFCKPENVYTNPKEKLSPVLFQKIYEDMDFMIKSEGPKSTREAKLKKFKEVIDSYKFSDEALSYGASLISSFEDSGEGRFEAMARLRGVLIQELARKEKSDPGYLSDVIGESLVERGVFTESVEGEPVCPFLGLEAFREALAGREQVLKSSHKSKIKNPDLITVVDYSRPSNERRMFTIDLKTKKIIHNTWVAHGGGVDRLQEYGVDQKGSSPQTSNASNSRLSSEGFYIAKASSFGPTFLNNLTLEGIDENNAAMGSRGIVIHGWRTPSSEYTDKTWVMSDDNKKRLPGVDIYKNYMSVDFKNTKEDLFDLSSPVHHASKTAPVVSSTDGCLGVSDTYMDQVDRKGRLKSQLELFREDLPGTLMFNFTGPGKTKSKYLKF